MGYERTKLRRESSTLAPRLLRMQSVQSDFGEVQADSVSELISENNRLRNLCGELQRRIEDLRRAEAAANEQMQREIGKRNDAERLARECAQQRATDHAALERAAAMLERFASVHCGAAQTPNVTTT